MIIKKINNSKIGNVKSSKNQINNKKIHKKKGSSSYTEKKGKKDSKKVISKSKSNKKNLQTKVSKNKPEKSEKVKSSKKKDNQLNDINVKEPKIKKKPSKKLKINEIAKKVSSKIKNKVNKVFSENKKKRKRNSAKNSMDSCDKKRQSSESVLNRDNKDRAKCNIKRVSRSPSLPKSVLGNVGCGTRNSTSNCISNDTLSSVKDNKVNYSNTKLDKSKMKDDPSKKSKLSQDNVNDKKKVLKKDLDKKKDKNTKKQNESLNKKQNESLSKKQNGTETSKNLSKSKNKMNQKNKKDKLKKQSKKTSVNKKPKINDSVNRKHRVASLNALAKVRVLSENDNDQDRSGEHEGSDHDIKNIIGKKEQKKQKEVKQQEVKNNKKEKNHKNYSKTSKAIVPVDNSKKQLAVKKRKLVDDCVEIIDTRTCKRMASLNASAILAASYSPLIKRSKSSESNKSINKAGSSVKMIREMQIKATVSHYEITPSCGTINGIQRSEVNSVILKEQKHETVETIKQMKMSSKMKERLIGIARLEESEEAKRKRKNKRKINRHSDDDNEEEDDDVVNQIGALGGGVSEFQATKVHVTKVTKINTSNKKNEKDKKSKGHKIESILERDSSVVRKYQVQTKSTSQSFCVQMQTTYNSSSSNDNLITASGTPALVPPIQQVNPSGVQLQLSSTPAHIIPTPFITQTHSQIASSQPTYINYPGHPSILQIPHQAVASSAPHINPLSIVNLAEPYSSHYSSAFSVPHFANHPHGPYAYYHPEFYQPTGSLIQSIHDPCLIHKPIPFHPANQPIRHIHRPQFNPGSLHTTSIIPTVQTFQNDATQLFQPTPSNLIRPPQTVLFNPPTATFTLVNSNVQIAQPNVNLSEQYPNSEIQLINTTNNNNGSILSQPTNNTTEYSCKSVQCSPPTSQTINVSSTASKHSSANMNNNNFNKIPNVATVHPQVTKRQLNKSSDNSIRKKKSSLLLKPTDLNKSDITSQTVASQTSIDDHPPHQHTKKVKSALTPANLNRINNMVNTCSNHQANAVVVLNQPTKTISIQVSLSPSPSPTTIPRMLTLKKSNKKKFSHGWNWEGDPFEKLIYLCVSI